MKNALLTVHVLWKYQNHKYDHINELRIFRIYLFNNLYTSRLCTNKKTIKSVRMYMRSTHISNGGLHKIKRLLKKMYKNSIEEP